MSRFELPTCRWRRPVPWAGRQGCTSPIVQAGPFGVMDHQCWMCPEANHLDQAAVAERHDQAGAVRHLLFHLYPVGDWLWHAQQLRRYMPLFNGRRLVSAAVGPDTATAADVRDALAGAGCSVMTVQNSPDLKEMTTYPAMLAMMGRYTSPADCHFYGHSKGVVSANTVGPGARRWAEAMYEALLGHWPAVARALQTHAACGIFRRLWRGPLRSEARWHYSGSFRWVRNADLFARDWGRIERNWLGSETHVGMVLGLGESDCLYGEFDTTDIGLYADSEWDRWAEPRRREWLAAHVEDEEEPELVTVILTSARQPELVHQAIESVRAQTSDRWELLIVDAGELAAAGAFDAYKQDARCLLVLTGETDELRSRVGIQAWAINEAFRRNHVGGSLVACLSDDDYFSPDWLATAIAAARANPDQGAWCGVAHRRSRSKDGRERSLGQLAPGGVGSPAWPLRGRVDGMQVVCRRSSWVEWPEAYELRAEADGHWMDRLAAQTPIHPLDALVGVHRHTPASTFTRGVSC